LAVKSPDWGSDDLHAGNSMASQGASGGHSPANRRYHQLDDLAFAANDVGHGAAGATPFLDKSEPR
jgi:hypothetical protein